MLLKKSGNSFSGKSWKKRGRPKKYLAKTLRYDMSKLCLPNSFGP